VRDGGAGEPGGADGKLARRQGPVAIVAVGEHLLDDRLVAVLVAPPGGLERRIGEDRVMAPDREQPVLPGGVLVLDAADDQPPVHGPHGSLRFP